MTLLGVYGFFALTSRKMVENSRTIEIARSAFLGLPFQVELEILISVGTGILVCHVSGHLF